MMMHSAPNTPAATETPTTASAAFLASDAAQTLEQHTDLSKSAQLTKGLGEP